MKNLLFIYGNGGLGKEVYDIAVRSNKYNDIYFINDFINDNISVFDFSYVISHFLETENCEFSVAIGELFARQKIFKKLLDHKCFLATLIDPNAVVSPHSLIGHGSIICPFVMIGPNVEIKACCLINVNSVIGHDIKIDENTIISASVSIGGSAKIGKNVYIGMGAIVKELLTIGDNSILGMGSVLHNNLDSNLLALGNPARPMRKIDDNFIVFK
jgi:sugar O-acyltransferase (sialic acid O-acetyltransferase NeuD family)